MYQKMDNTENKTDKIVKKYCTGHKGMKPIDTFGVKKNGELNAQCSLCVSRARKHTEKGKCCHNKRHGRCNINDCGDGQKIGERKCERCAKVKIFDDFKNDQMKSCIECCLNRSKVITKVVVGIIEELKDELGEKLKDELGEELKDELGEELKDELGEELKDELGEKLKDEFDEELKDEFGEELGEEFDEEFDEELKDELDEELDEELKEELKEELGEELGEELKDEIKYIKCTRCFTFKEADQFKVIGDKRTKSCKSCKSKSTTVKTNEEGHFKCLRCLTFKEAEQFNGIGDKRAKRCKSCLSKSTTVESNEEGHFKCVNCFIFKEADQFKGVDVDVKRTKRCKSCLSKRTTVETNKEGHFKCLNCLTFKEAEQFKGVGVKRAKRCKSCLSKRTTVETNKEGHFKCLRCLTFKEANQFNGNKNKTKYCKDCSVLYRNNIIKNFCEHNTIKNRCVKCKGSCVCEHSRVKYRCKICSPQGHLAHTIRSRVSKALKANKSKCSIEYLGISIDKYKTFIEEKFEPDMCWGNHGSLWDIDHIIPLEYDNPTIEVVIERLHYLNTQPLYCSDNRSKGNRYIG